MTEGATTTRPGPTLRPGLTSANAEISGRTRGDALVYQAAALVLAYPRPARPPGRHRVGTFRHNGRAALRPVLAHLRGDSLRELQSFHVLQEFDLSRRHALPELLDRRWPPGAGATCWPRSSRSTATRGWWSTPAANCPTTCTDGARVRGGRPGAQFALLERFRASLELIRLELAADHLPHAGVLTAICTRLPGESRATVPRFRPASGRRNRSSWSAWISSR